MAIRRAGPAFWDRLSHEIEGDAASDLFTRGRYATDASMYQCFPAGVVCPRSANDAAIVVEMAREEGLPVIARGGGASTNEDKRLAKASSSISPSISRGSPASTRRAADARWSRDARLRRCRRRSTRTIFSFRSRSSAPAQATIGGMLGGKRNLSGLRAMRYGSMRDAIRCADALLADGQRVLFSSSPKPMRSPFRGATALSICSNSAKSMKRPSQPTGRCAHRARTRNLKATTSAPCSPIRKIQNLPPAGRGRRHARHRDQDRAEARRRSRRTARSAYAAHRSWPRASGRSESRASILPPSSFSTRPCSAFSPGTQYADTQAARLLRGEPDALLIVEFDEDDPVDNTRLLKSLADVAAEVDKGRFSVIEFIGENARAALWRLRCRRRCRPWRGRRNPRASPCPSWRTRPFRFISLPPMAPSLRRSWRGTKSRPPSMARQARGCLSVRPSSIFTTLMTASA